MGITTAVAFYNIEAQGEGGGSRHNVVTRLTSGSPREIVIRIPKFPEDLSPSPKRPNRQWDPSNLLFNVYRGFFSLQ
jgi:hypothetical protein